jgi:pimeloyl-ACP methyl ester carboxylesterase
MSDGRSPQRPIRTVGMIAGTVALLLIAGFVWNVVVVKWQHWRNPVPGDFYQIDGRVMHLYCTGHGPQTILIEVGGSADWLGWQGVQTRLSSLTRVCTYDRAGHGWSEPREGVRDAEAIVGELHALLTVAGVPRPLVLTGHSLGGLYVREYAREFGSEVVGVVLVESSTPHQIDELPGWRQSYEADVRNFPAQRWRDRLRVWSGWERLTGQCHNEPSPELQHLSGQYDAEMCRPAYVDADQSELPYFEAASSQSARLVSFGDVPLLIISADPERTRGGMDASAVAELPIWEQEQETQKALSVRSWRVVARGAGHTPHHERLGLVVAEITRLVQYLHGGPAPPFGRTLIE